MESQEIRCFVALSEELNFSRAAARMNMTQPPFSRQIRLLEERLGTVLFNRSTRQVTLTSAGVALLPFARASAASLAALADESKRILNGTAGELRIGFTSGAAYDFLPRLVRSIGASFPDVRLHLDEMGTNDQINRIRNDELDFGFIRVPSESYGLHISLAEKEPWVLAVAAGHPLAVLERDLVADDLSGEDFLMYAPDSNQYLYSTLLALFSCAGVVPERVLYIRAVHTILPLVASGLALAVVPVSAARLRVDGVVFRPLVGPLAGTSELYLAHQRQPRNIAAVRILAALRNDGGLP